MKQTLPAATLAIFGVSGDLSGRYLLPALGAICQNEELSTDFKVLGISRRPLTTNDILNDKTAGLARRLSLFQMNYDLPDDYEQLKSELKDHSGDIIFYFAVPPEAVLPIVKNLGAAGLNTPRYKLLMEKPFGHDLASAGQLIKQISRCFKEEQVYRIDHYLAKEAAQNIAVFLGSNVIFRGIWSREFIEKIEIVAEESIGIEGRAGFYEQTGALRDIVQSHLLQLAALTLMEPCPDVFDFSQMQRRRQEALKQLTAEPNSVYKAQYDGYKEEVGSPNSKIETFVSLKMHSSAPKWRGVPIRLITGKRLNEKLTEIRVYFKKTQDAQTNLLNLRIQPREGIELELWVKKPGYEQELQKLPLDFSYQQYFGRLPDAYEQVIVDAIRSRNDLFAASGEVLASWAALTPVLERWGTYPLHTYKPGSTVKEITS